LFFRGRAPSTSSSIYNIRCAATKSCRESGASEQNMIFSSNMRYFGKWLFGNCAHLGTAGDR
jgi:hypothetical protein